MTAVLLTDSGAQFPLTPADVERLAKGMHVHHAKTNGNQTVYTLREYTGYNYGRYRAAVIVANSHSEAADILRSLPTN